jgi:hypothetical protein
MLQDVLSLRSKLLGFINQTWPFSLTHQIQKTTHGEEQRKDVQPHRTSSLGKRKGNISSHI